MLTLGNQRRDLKSLERDLRNYGLNPQDWKVVREKPNFYQVQALEDQDFMFRGRVVRKGLRLAWKKLELASI